MTDPKITIKSLSRKLSGSLIRRILYGSLILVGLPLLIHTLFLYRREYRENITDEFISLRLFGKSCSLSLEQLIHEQQDILQDLIDSGPALPSKEDLQSLELHNILYLSPYDDSALQEFPFLQEKLKEPSFVILVPEKRMLYIGRNFVNNSFVTALSSLSFDDIFAQLAKLKDPSISSAGFSFINETNQIVFSTEKILENAQYVLPNEQVSWEPQKDVSDGWLATSQEGSFLTVRFPIAQTNYSLLLDLPKQGISSIQIKDYVFRIASFLLILCIVGGGLLAWLVVRLSKPFYTFCATMNAVSEGAIHRRFTKDWLGFEINILGSQLNQMLDALLNHRDEAERERTERERLAQELKIGHQIQTNLLSLQLPEAFPLEVASGYLSAREVSGDFYDLFTLEDGRMLITIADAADKGISACLFSLSFRSALRMAAVSLKDLFSVVQMANAVLLRDTAASSSFITAWIGLYDPRTKELTYCSQGHPPALLRKERGEILELSSHGIALGIEEIHPQPKRITLEEGDLLLLYTDGVIEAQSPKPLLFGKTRLDKLLRLYEGKTSQGFVDQLLTKIHTFCQKAALEDDLTILALKVFTKKTVNGPQTAKTTGETTANARVAEEKA